MTYRKLIANLKGQNVVVKHQSELTVSQYETYLLQMRAIDEEIRGTIVLKFK